MTRFHVELEVTGTTVDEMKICAEQRLAALAGPDRPYIAAVYKVRPHIAAYIDPSGGETVQSWVADVDCMIMDTAEEIMETARQLDES